MNLHSLIYAALCVVVPAAWGLLVYWISRRVEARVFHDDVNASPSTASSKRLPLDFHI
jgi:hypothetical protein